MASEVAISDKMFFDMGMEDYKNGVPCRPYQSEKLMGSLFKDGLKNQEHFDYNQNAMKQWANGWVSAMMKATDEELRQAGVLP